MLFLLPLAVVSLVAELDSPGLLLPLLPLSKEVVPDEEFSVLEDMLPTSMEPSMPRLC